MPTPETKKEKSVNLPYQLFTLVLCVLVIGLLFFETTQETEEEVRRLFTWADYFLCIVFFLDFIYLLITSENRKRYMITWGWIDLLSCIPTFGWGRIARIIRILKLLRTIRTGQNIIRAISQRRGESALLTATIILVFATLFGSVAILMCEIDEPDGNILNAPDAVWWTFCMLMKGGCENYDPVSIEGRFVAVVLMFLGMVFSATIIGFVAVLLTSGGSQSDPDSSLENSTNNQHNGINPEERT